jgi:hypothetical protein
VGSLAQENDDVIAAFTAAQQLLESTWQKQDAADRIRQAEAAKALLHVEQRNLLAQHIGMEFRAKLDNPHAPPSVKNFLFGPWAQVLAERKIQGAAPSERFDHLADNLLWTTNLKKARKNPSRLVQLVPEVVRTLREGLRSVDYPDEMLKEFFDELIALHEAALEGLRRRAEGEEIAEEDVPTQPAAIEPQTEGKPEFWVAQKEGADAGFVAQTADHAAAQPTFDTLPLGTWVDMMLEGRQMRANLRWMSPYENLYMFVERDGTQHSMTRASADRMRSAGHLRVVAQGGMVDAALDRVADTALKNSAKSAQDQG